MSSTKNSLKTIPTSELFIALEYAEKLAEAARAKTAQTLQFCKEKKIDAGNHFADELRKLWEVFEEHNDLSFHIEKELDLRLKPKLKNRYGAKSLFDLGHKIDTKMSELFGTDANEAPKKSEGVAYK